MTPRCRKLRNASKRSPDSPDSPDMERLLPRVVVPQGKESDERLRQGRAAIVAESGVRSGPDAHRSRTKAVRTARRVHAIRARRITAPGLRRLPARLSP